MNEFESPDPPELHAAAAFGMSISEVDQHIRAAADVDSSWWGRTALFEAVMNREHEIALRLVAAGADPWRPQMAGWSPGRLSLTGAEPGLFGPGPATVDLTAEEQASVSRSRRLIELLGDFELEGMSIACVAGIDSAEAARRLRAEPVSVGDFDDWVEDPEGSGMTDDEVVHTVGASDVSGGCVVTQWTAYTPSIPGVMSLLTAGTSGYGMYSNPKSGNQGSRFRDGVMLAWDLHPGGGQPAPDDSSDEILRSYLYRGHPFAYCCDAVNLEPTDLSAFAGPPDRMLRLPALDLWPGES